MERTISAEYVCNAGILLYIPDHVIGVDVFAACENGFYKNTPSQQKETIFRLIRDRSLKLLIFTHQHCDHYCREDILEAVRIAEENHNPLRIMTTGQAAEDLIRGGADSERIVICNEAACYNSSGQIVPEENAEAEPLSADDTRIIGFYTRHDGHQYASV